MEGLGRLVACDLIGMGASDRIGTTTAIANYGEQRDFVRRSGINARPPLLHVVLVLRLEGSASLRLG